MKNILFAALATLALIGCNANQKSRESDSASQKGAPVIVAVYSGTIPAADVAGIRYRILFGDDGRFEMQRKYQASGDDGSQTEDAGGEYELVERPGYEAYYMLKAPGETLYFVQTSDSTITMTGADLKPAPSGLDYTLSRE